MFYEGAAEQRDLWTMTATVSSRQVLGGRGLGKCDGSENIAIKSWQPCGERRFPFLSIGKALSPRNSIDVVHQRDKSDSLSLSNFSNGFFSLKSSICQFVISRDGLSFLFLEGCTQRKDHTVWWAESVSGMCYLGSPRSWAKWVAAALPTQHFKPKHAYAKRPSRRFVWGWSGSSNSVTGRIENSPRVNTSHPYKQLEGRSFPTNVICLLHDRNVFTVGERSRDSGHGGSSVERKAQSPTPAGSLNSLVSFCRFYECLIQCRLLYLLLFFYLEPLLGGTLICLGLSIPTKWYFVVCLSNCYLVYIYIYKLGLSRKERGLWKSLDYRPLTSIIMRKWVSVV